MKNVNQRDKKGGREGGKSMNFEEKREGEKQEKKGRKKNKNAG